VPYRFAVDAGDYTDLASGRVFEGAPGHPAFPVRLASEIFQRCLAIRRARGENRPVSLYDPCCGGAYLLGTIGYLHLEEIERIAGSDVDEGILPLALRNLELLTLRGLDRRMAQLADLADRYGKDSHRAALSSARRMRVRVASDSRAGSLGVEVFPADALAPGVLLSSLAGRRIDVVVTDVPYGRGSAWGVPASAVGPPAHALLESLLPCLGPGAVVAVCADKAQDFRHEAYRRADVLGLGKRRVTILTRADG
jgi:23S rRNA (guanine2535-N1)-methyltransferase